MDFIMVKALLLKLHDCAQYFLTSLLVA